MRLFFHVFAAALVASCASVPADPARSRTAAAPDASASTASDYARRLFARFPERIVDVEEHRSGPGHPMLTHVTLYEQPEAAHSAGLCQVRVHTVTLPHVAPPADPPRAAEAVHTSTRYFAVGEVGPSPRPADQAGRCAALPSARNFFVATPDDAAFALQILTDARRFARDTPRAIQFDCSLYQQSCRDPRQLFLERLTTDRIAEVRRIACEPDRPGRGTDCFRYGFRRAEGLSGDWTLEIRGPARPLHVRIRQQPSPVV